MWWQRCTPAGIYLLKVKSRNTRTRCVICSKLTIKTPERHQWRRSGVFIVSFWTYFTPCTISLLFLICINDLSEGLSSNAKLFVDDTFLFSVVHDINTSAVEFNSDLKKSMIGPFSRKQLSIQIVAKKLKKSYSAEN